MSLYFLVSIFVFLKNTSVDYFNVFILSVCAILFTQNLNLLLTDFNVNYELFYELGGITLILSLSYFKLKKYI